VKRRIAACAAAVFVLMIAAYAGARTYAVYYDATEGHGTAIVLTNLFGEETLARLLAYDSSGNEVAAVDVRLGEYASEAVFVEELLDAASGHTWGLARVLTEGRVAAAAWIRDEHGWLTVDNVSIPNDVAGATEYSGYWLTANYANTENRMTGLSLVNSSDEQVIGEFYVYDSAGARTSVRSFELDPRSSAFVLLSEELEVAQTMWGMIDVHTNRPILLVAEYLDASGALIDVDVISRYYLVEP